MDLYVRNKHAARAIGAPPTSNYRQWPARLVDAFVALDREDKVIEHAMLEAAGERDE